MLNKAQIIGHLGADPEIRYTASGTAVGNFNVATSERWKNKDGEQQESTEWHRVTVWKRLAETCGEYIAKGSRVYVEGKLQTRKWEDRDGNTRYTTEIQAQTVQFLDSRKDSQGGGQGGGQSSGPPPMDDDDVPF